MVVYVLKKLFSLPKWASLAPITLRNTVCVNAPLVMSPNKFQWIVHLANVILHRIVSVKRERMLTKINEIIKFRKCESTFPKS